MATVEVINKGQTLCTTRKEFPKWYTQLQFHCMVRGIWESVDPDNYNDDGTSTGSSENPLLVHQKHQTHAEFTQALQERRQAEYVELVTTRNKLLEEQRGAEIPLPGTIELASTKDAYEQGLKLEALDSARNGALSNRHIAVMNWIKETMDTDLFAIATIKLVIRKDASLASLIHALKTMINPAESATMTSVADEYREVLISAKSDKQDPLTWYVKWNKAYLEAVEYKVADAIGPLASRDFIRATEKLMPRWSEQAMSDLIKNDELGLPGLSLEKLGRRSSLLVG